MAEIILTVGLPAVGKSYYANRVVDNNAKIVSSDDIRIELFGSDQAEGVHQDHMHKTVFKEVHKRTVEFLSGGYDVIYDATNTSRKRRAHLINHILPEDVYKKVIYFNDDIDNIKNNNNMRERVVPERVINNMYKNLQIPIYSEGWDEIVIQNNNKGILDSNTCNDIRRKVLTNDSNNLMKDLAQVFKDFANIYQMPQDSKYHKFSVSRHTYHVYKYIMSQCGNSSDKELLLWTALLHDIGKYHCKNFYNRKGERQAYANFISHDLVGSQIAVKILFELGFDVNFIHDVATLVQFHMYLLDEKASRQKLINRVGDRVFGYLQMLREADTESH